LRIYFSVVKEYFNKGILFFSCFAMIVSLCSWGFYTHETATQLAIYKLPGSIRTFYFSNIDSVTAQSVRPDKRKSTDKKETAKHFIDIENYGDNAINNMPLNWQAALEKYSWDTLNKYGYVPYQVLTEYSLLVNAFKQKNTDSIFFYAIDLAHYIEDANVPLHTTNNYDGQLTNQKGLHALWESTIPELEINNYNLYSAHKAIYIKDKPVTIWKAIQKAHALLPVMLAKEKEITKNFPDNSKYKEVMYYGTKTKMYTHEFARQYAAALGSSINDQLINSANMVADFWYSAWIDAGKPGLKKLYTCTRKSGKALCKELRSYKKNDLLKDSLLRVCKE
jgi:hypothetical protein